MNKTLNVKDYDDLKGYVQHVKNIIGVLHGLPSRFEHEHRYWEYAVALKVITEKKLRTVLSVGGGGSVFEPSAAWVGHEVTVIDNGDVGSWIAQQNSRTGKYVRFYQEDFISCILGTKYDAVVCLSVLEHIPNDIEFFKKLLSAVRPGGALVMTVDFHPSGTQMVSGHIRSYNKTSLESLIEIARRDGFIPLGKPDYDYFEPNVNGCTFASLVLVRKVDGN